MTTDHQIKDGKPHNDINMMMMVIIMNFLCGMVESTKGVALFPAVTIVRDPHYRKSATRHEQDGGFVMVRISDIGLGWKKGYAFHWWTVPQKQFITIIIILISLWEAAKNRSDHQVKLINTNSSQLNKFYLLVKKKIIIIIIIIITVIVIIIEHAKFTDCP